MSGAKVKTKTSKGGGAPPLASALDGPRHTPPNGGHPRNSPDAPILDQTRTISQRHVQIGELVDAKPGFACGEDVVDGVFQFRMNNITSDCKIDFSKKRRVPKNTKKIQEYFLSPGDVLFNATNSPELVGKCAFFSGHHEPATFSNHFFRLRPDPMELEGRFLTFWLSLQFQKQVFRGLCKQWVNQASVSRDALLALQIPLPPLPEQRRIADVLDRVEELRAKRREVIASLESVPHAIFIEMFGDPVENKKAIPLVALGEICDVRDGTHDSPKYVSRDGFPLVTSKNLSSGRIDLSEVNYISETDYTQINKRSRVDRGDILMPMIGTIGNPVLVDIEPRFAIKNVALIKFPKLNVSPIYIKHLLSGSYFDFVVGGKNRGGTQKFVSLGDIRKMPIPYSPYGLQQEFARRIAAVEKLKATHRASLAQLDSLFASLQHRAFRGEL